MRVRVGNNIYRQASPSVPSWEEVWSKVQEARAFETELDYALTDAPELDEGVVWDRLQEEYYAYYEGIVEELSAIDGVDCWRAVTLDPHVDPTILDPLGIYWAFDQEEAFPHWDYLQEPKGRKNVVFRAEVDSAALDVSATVLANVSPATREGGTELRFQAGSQLYVYDVTLEDGTVVPINDWRRT